MAIKELNFILSGENRSQAAITSMSADLRDLTTDLDALDGRSVEVPVELRDRASAELRGISSSVSALDGESAVVTASLRDLASAGLKDVTRSVEALDERDCVVDVEVKGGAASVRELTVVERARAAMDDRDIEFDVKVNSKGALAEMGVLTGGINTTTAATEGLTSAIGGGGGVVGSTTRAGKFLGAAGLIGTLGAAALAVPALLASLGPLAAGLTITGAAAVGIAGGFGLAAAGAIPLVRQLKTSAAAQQDVTKWTVEVEKAQENLNKAYRKGDPEKVAKAQRSLSKATERLAFEQDNARKQAGKYGGAIGEIGDEFDKLRRQVLGRGTSVFEGAARELAPLTRDALRLANNALPAVGKSSKDNAAAFRRAFGDVREELGGNERNSLQGILASFPRQLESGTRAVGKFGGGFVNFLKEVMPSAERFWETTEGIADDFLKWSRSDKAREQIASWLKTAAPIAKELGKQFLSVGGAIVKLGEEHGDEVRIMIHDLGELAKAVLWGADKFLDFMGNVLRFRDQAGAAISDFVSDSRDRLAGLVEGAIEWFAGLPGAVKQSILQTVDNVLGPFDELYMKLLGKSVIPNIVNESVEWFESLPGKALEALKDLPGKGAKPFQDLYDRVVGNSIVPDLHRDVVKELGRVPRSAEDALKELPDRVSGRFGLAARDAKKHMDELSKASGDLPMPGNSPGREMRGLADDTGKELRQMARSADRDADDMKKSVVKHLREARRMGLDEMRDLSVAGQRHAGQMRKGVVEEHQGLQRGATREMGQTRKDGLTSFEELSKGGKRLSGELRKGSVDEHESLQKLGSRALDSLGRGGATSLKDLTDNGVKSASMLQKEGTRSLAEFQSGGSRQAETLRKNASTSSEGMRRYVTDAASRMQKDGVSQFGMLQKEGSSESDTLRSNASKHMDSARKSIVDDLTNTRENGVAQLSDFRDKGGETMSEAGNRIKTPVGDSALGVQKYLNDMLYGMGQVIEKADLDLKKPEEYQPRISGQSGVPGDDKGTFRAMAEGGVTSSSDAVEAAFASRPFAPESEHFGPRSPKHLLVGEGDYDETLIAITRDPAFRPSNESYLKHAAEMLDHVAISKGDLAAMGVMHPRSHLDYSEAEDWRFAEGGMVRYTAAGKYGIPNSQITSSYEQPYAAWHKATDIAAPQGTPFYAVFKGQLDHNSGGGNPYDFGMNYGHGYAGYVHNMARAAPGMYEPGDKIGEVDTYGQASGSHVHLVVNPSTDWNTGVHPDAVFGDGVIPGGDYKGPEGGPAATVDISPFIEEFIKKVPDFGKHLPAQEAEGMASDAREAIVSLLNASAPSSQTSSVSSGPMSQDQKDVAEWMASEAVKRMIPDVLPVMTSLVESGLRNLNYGDGTSLGYFQMIDLHGTAEQRTDPAFALDWFLDNAEATRRSVAWTDAQGLGMWAQDVQRSAFPDRYAQEYGTARGLVGPPPPGKGAGMGGPGAFTAGGVALRPHLASVAENGPEFFMPLHQPDSARKFVDFLRELSPKGFDDDEARARHEKAVAEGERAEIERRATGQDGRTAAPRGSAIGSDAQAGRELSRLREETAGLRKDINSVLKEQLVVMLEAPRKTGENVRRSVSDAIRGDREMHRAIQTANQRIRERFAAAGSRESSAEAGSRG